MTGHSRLDFVVLVLALSVMSAYICAAAFVATLYLSLLSTDSAYGQSLGAWFSDPFVLTIAGTVGTAAGLVAFPIALFCLRRRDLIRCGAFVVGVTVLFIVGVTTVAPRVALIGAPVVALAALLVSRFGDLRFFRHGPMDDVA